MSAQLIVNGVSVAIPSDYANVALFPESRAQFVSLVRDVAALPEAGEPETSSSTLCVSVRVDPSFIITVYASADMKPGLPKPAPTPLPGAEVLDAAVAEAVAS